MLVMMIAALMIFRMNLVGKSMEHGGDPVSGNGGEWH
jgi:hypothetical protein